MPFCDDLKVLFPNYVMEYHKGSISVKEKSASAKVREVVWCNADFQYIDPTIVKDMTSFFQKSGAPDIFHADCDGILIFEGNDGRKYMFFSELYGAYETALAKLDPEVRETLLLSRQEKLKYAEIAQRLDISVRTVEARISKALKFLQHNLQIYRVLLFITLCACNFL